MTEDTNQTNDFVNQAGDFAKQQTISGLNLLLGTLKKSFSFQGRATRKEFWTFFVTGVLINFILFCLAILFGFIGEFLAKLVLVLLVLVDICLFFPSLSVSVRRLHDLNLTGFWLWYLSPVGLAIVFMVNLLDLDNSCNAVMEKVTKSCTSWVAWMFLPFFWWFGAPISQFLLYLYKGKNEPNDFGPSPY